MVTKVNEKSLEDLIVNYLVEINGYEKGVSDDYNKEFAIDEKRLKTFLKETQNDIVEKSLIFENEVNRKKFFERVRDEISKKGVLRVLRRGIKHQSYSFDLYNPTPSKKSNTGQNAYNANKFCVIQQLYYSNTNKKLSIDIVIFINGLPIITMELKNHITGQDVSNAIYQYRNDRDPKDLLFASKRCAVHFAVDDSEIMMCTELKGKKSWFLPFNKGVKGGAGNPVNYGGGLKTSYLWEEILKKLELSNIIENYAGVLISHNQRDNKKVYKNIWPRYHQLDVVKQLLKVTEESPIGRRFLIQHSAGSGKSNSISWLAYQLVELERNNKPLFDSIIIVTDRINLDKQLSNNIKSFRKDPSLVERSDSSADLKNLLESGKKIIFTTIQKFPFILETVSGTLAKRTFAVIIDEAHSSQAGRSSSKLNVSLSGGMDILDSNDVDGDRTGEDYINDLIEDYIRKKKMASNANFYAFTATPKSKTLEMFGEPVTKKDGEIAHKPFHTYSMRQAIEEGFILDVLKGYITYNSYYRIAKSIEDDPEFDRRQAQKKLRYFVESKPETIKAKSKVILDHFHNKICRKIKGEARAMVVTNGIERAISYYYEITELLKERNSPYEAIVAFSGTKNYNGKDLTESNINGFPSQEIESRFRTGNYRFLIVANKFQTGYDEPLLHTMYVDKPLSGVKTVQTLSRLNRTCPGKVDTCIIDFVNDTDSIQKDFQRFYETTILSKETDPNVLNDLIDEIEEHSIYNEDEVEKLNHSFWSNDSRNIIDGILDVCTDRFNDIDEDSYKVEIKKAMKSFIRTYEFLSMILPYEKIEWEKKNIFYSLLIKKLPKLKQEDWTEGLFDAVDSEEYRLIKKEEKDIKLENEDTEIDPLQSSIKYRINEPDFQKLSTIVEEFNKVFGNIDWTSPDIVKDQIDNIANKISKKEVVLNTIKKEEKANIDMMLDEEIKGTLTQIADSSSELYSEFWNNEQFKNILTEYISYKLMNIVRG